MRLTKEQLREAIEKVYHAMCAGDDESDIIDELSMTTEEYEKLKQNMFDVKSDELMQKPVEHIYVQYIIDQIQNIRDLNDIIGKAKETKNVNAVVSAIRTRSDILDKLIARGQEFGVIHKQPDTKIIHNGIVVAELSRGDLKKLITKSLSDLNQMVKNFGDANIMDVEPGELHIGPPNTTLMLDEKKVKVVDDSEQKKDKDKYNKANNSKVRGGRKITPKKRIKVLE